MLSQRQRPRPAGPGRVLGRILGCLLLAGTFALPAPRADTDITQQKLPTSSKKYKKHQKKLRKHFQKMRKKPYSKRISNKKRLKQWRKEQKKRYKEARKQSKKNHPTVQAQG